MATEPHNYVMGHTDRERRRLALQASLLNPLTDGFLRRAGISAGMRVLEVGCGVGEVSLIAARLVGPHGQVHCLDIDEVALETARGRVRSAGHDHVTFEKCEIDNFRPDQPYDAVMGRHVLIHMKDAPGVLRNVVAMVGTGGVIAFQEFDLSFCPRGYPDLPLAHAVEDAIVQFFLRATPRPNIGSQLFHLMQQAGLPPPACRAENIIDGGPHSPIYEWIAETLRSLLPGLQKLGMTAAAELCSEDLAQRLRDEALAANGVLIAPSMIGAFARKRA